MLKFCKTRFYQWPKHRMPRSTLQIRLKNMPNRYAVVRYSIRNVSLPDVTFQQSCLLQEATLYVHWPYCEKLCTFCNFNKYLRNDSDERRMSDCLVEEAETLIRISGVKKIKSIFFGGGTPSLITPSTLEAIVRKVRNCALLEKDSEITLECNPTVQATHKLRGFKAAGINRISCGIQTLNEKDLKFLGRNHTVEEGLRFLEEAKRNFPGHVSVDVLFGRPKQTTVEWKQELERILSFCDNHLSLYQLTVEKGTRLFQQVQRGQVTMPCSTTTADMYEKAVNVLEANGFKQYEASNFSKEDAFSRHNMAYWDGTQYIGIGPGAHGRFASQGLGKTVRCARVQASEPTAWMKEVEKCGHATRREIPLSKQEVLEELLMTGLRTARGLQHERWHELGGDFTFAQHPEVQKHIANGYIQLTPKYMRPTKKGIAVADRLTLDLLLALRSFS